MVSGVDATELGGALGLVVAGATGVGDKSPDDQSVHGGTVRSGAPTIKELPAVPTEITPSHTVHSPTISSWDRLLALVGNANGVQGSGKKPSYVVPRMLMP